MQPNLKTHFLADYYFGPNLRNREGIKPVALAAGIRLDNYVDLSSGSRLISVHKLLIVVVKDSFGQALSFESTMRRIHPDYKSRYRLVIFLSSSMNGPFLFSLKPSVIPESSLAYDSLRDAFLECYRRVEAFGNNTLFNGTETKTIEFSPEHKQAGLQILNYFQETLNQKYPGNDVSVRIGQKGNTVTIEIETPDGKTELYEEALEEYGMVVTGQKPVEEYLENPLDQAALQYKLEMAHAELNMNTKLMAAKDQIIENQKDQLARQDQSLIFFRQELSLATRANRFALKELSTVAKSALEKNDPVELFKWMDRVLSDNGPEALASQLEATKEEDPDLYESIITRANAVVDGAATKAMSAGLFELLQELAKDL